MKPVLPCSLRLLFGSLALLFAANGLAQPGSQIGTTNSSAPRVLILSGGRGHDWRSSTFFLRHLLEEAGHCDVRVCESPAGITAGTFAAFDVVVDDYSGPRLGRATEEALAAFVDSGKGLVVTHGGLIADAEQTWPSFARLVGASRKADGTNEPTLPFQLLNLKIARPEHLVMSGLNNPLRTADRPLAGLKLHHGILNFQKWPWWYEEVVGGLYRLERQGAIPNSTVKFGEEHMITPVGHHPITAGLGAFHVTDETYKGLFISPNIKPLLITDNPTSDRTVAWIGPCSTSKVVFIQLGHDHSPFRHPSYRALVHNSILWSAGKLK